MTPWNHRAGLVRRAVAAVTSLGLLATLTVTAGLAPVASAATGHDVEGVVTHVDDGDTLHVDVPGEGEHYIRMTGINTAELTRYANDPKNWQGKCQGVAAAKRLHQLVFGKRVRIFAQDASSSSGKRMRRSIAVEINGVWTDVGGILIDEGLALYMPNPVENHYNRDYLRRAQVAAANRVGWYNTSSCGVGPSQDANLSLVVQWDAPGNDGTNLNGEFFKIVNRGSTAVDLTNWWVRDSAMRGTKDYPGYRMPSGTVVRAGGSLLVRVGRGTDTATTKYWGLTQTIFDNVTGAPSYMGDGGYLFDPQGDLRAWYMYPCNEFCPVPALSGKLAVTKIVSNPDGVDTAKKEYVVVKNISPARVSLVGNEVRAGSKRWTFRSGSWLNPGEQVVVYMGRGTRTRLKQYIGLTAPALANRGGTSLLLDPLGTQYLCRAWARGRC